MNNTIRLVSGLVVMGCTVALAAIAEVSEFRRHRTQKKLDVAEAKLMVYKIIKDADEYRIRNLQNELNELKNMGVKL